MKQVTRDFEKEYQQLNHHRFSIWSRSKTRSATVFEQMIEKREEQLQQPTGHAPDSKKS